MESVPGMDSIQKLIGPIGVGRFHEIVHFSFTKEPSSEWISDTVAVVRVDVTSTREPQYVLKFKFWGVLSFVLDESKYAGGLAPGLWVDPVESTDDKFARWELSDHEFHTIKVRAYQVEVELQIRPLAGQ